MKHLMFFALAAFACVGLACGSTQSLPADCAVLAGGECFPNTQAACDAAGCPDDCRLLESDPPQVQCPQPEPEPVVEAPDQPSVQCLGGWVDDSATTGEIPEDCGFRVGECCFHEQAPACREAGCEDTCVVLESYPAQIRCE